MFEKYLTILISFFLIGCAHNDTAVQVDVSDIIDHVQIEESFPVLDNSLFGRALPIEQPNEILALTPEQIESFDNFAKSNYKNRELQSHERIYKYLESKSTNFKYKDITFIANRTLNTMTGNCMSLAVLTAAFAKHSNVKIEYQLVNRIPIYQEYGGIIFNARHIRTALFEPLMREAGVRIYRSYAVIDYYPSRFNYVDGIVNEDGFFAMYYRNRSAEELGAGNHERSYYYLLESLKYEPEHEEAINNLAVLHRRIGEEEKAEELYLYGIKNAKNKLTLLRNYKAMLAIQNRVDEVAAIQAKLDEYEDENPFEWIRAGNNAFDQKEYVIAKQFFEKAAEMAPYLHQAYFGMAKAEYMLGNPRATKNALNKALEEAYDQESKSVYEAKLEALSRERLN